MRSGILLMACMGLGACVTREFTPISGSDVEDLTGGSVEPGYVWHLGTGPSPVVLISVPGTATSLTLTVTGGSSDWVAVRAPAIGSGDSPVVAVIRACDLLAARALSRIATCEPVTVDLPAAFVGRIYVAPTNASGELRLSAIGYN